jgi:hypothetical protein
MITTTQRGYNADVVLTFAQQREPDEHTTFQLITEGIGPIKGMVSQLDDYQFRKEIYGMDDAHVLLETLYLHGRIFSIVQNGVGVSDCMAKLLDLSKAVAGKPSCTGRPLNTMEKEFRSYIDQIVQSLRAAKLQGNESVITAYCPIVPYVGTLSKPFVEETKHGDNVPVIQYEDDQYVIAETRRRALLEMTKMVMDHQCCQHLVRHSNLYEMIPGAEHLTKVMAMVQSDKGKDGPCILYLGWAFLFKNAHCLTQQPVKDMVETLNHMESATFDHAFESVLENLPYDTETLNGELDIFDDNDQLGKFVTDPQKFRNEQNAPPTAHFDLDHLFNYIHSTRRYRANNYTNSAFVRNAKVGAFSFYDEYMVIEPQSLNGEKLDYIYVPVIDDLNGSNVVIIKYWRNKRIDILTPTQYEDETKEEIEG